MGYLSRIIARLGQRGTAQSVRPSSDGGPQPAPMADAGAAAHATAVALGKRALGERDYAAAAAKFRQAIELRHDDAETHCELGVACMKLQQFEDAADCFQMAAHFRDDYADPHYNLGLLAQRQGKLPTAIAHLEQAIRRRPDYADAHNLLGACWLGAGDVQRAVAAFARAVELSPDNAHFQSNLGYVLVRDLGDLERGLSHMETALRLNATDAAIQCNYSSVLAYQGRIEEVVAVCDRLLAANPALDEARLNRALALLKMERFGEAWPDYEARRRTRSNYLPRPFTFREWRGETLAGKTILVYAEQGLGDEIMFASCLPEILRQAGRCVVECSPRLASLFARSFPSAVVHGAEQTDPDVHWLQSVGVIDYQIAAGSLPGFFRRRREDFPAHNGYLRADPARVEIWRARLDTPERPLKIGIAWRGGMASTRRSQRSLELAGLLPLLCTPGTHFVSLQHDATPAEVAAVGANEGVRLDHHSEVVADLDETAALVSALDVVVTVCSANVHLTGALGPARVGDGAGGRRMALSGARRSMPWYPGVRMFRQTAAGDWHPVIDAITRELAGLRNA